MKTQALTLLAVLLPPCKTAVATPDEIHWTIRGSTSVTFDWRGSSTENKISYGTSSKNYTATVTAVTPNPVPTSSSGPFWEANLSGLKANTRYFYSIAGGPEHSFRTPQHAGNTDFIVYAVGDIGSTGSYSEVGPVQKIIANTYGNGFPRFVLMVGDLSYGDINGNSDVDQHFNDVMKWSQNAAYMPAWGNHEWNSSSTPPDDFYNYLGRFSVPHGQTSPGTSNVFHYAKGEDWNWFDYGNIRFIAYPQSYSSATLSDWNTQVQSIMSKAQNDPDITFIVTFGHSPAYSSSQVGVADNILKGYLDGLAQRYPKYTLNLCGHHHHYERSDPNQTFGVTHIIAGTGHANSVTFTNTQPPWSVFRTKQSGALKLHFVDNSQGTFIDGEFICAPTSSVCDKAGKVLDSFRIQSP